MIALEVAMHAFGEAMKIPDPIRESMADAGITPPDTIIADGTLHRFHIEGDKTGTYNGWYVFYQGSLPAGAFGCWKRSVSLTWCGKSRDQLSTDERQKLHEQLVSAKQQRNAERRKILAEAAVRAQSIWSKSAHVTIHSYLTAKQVNAHSIRQSGNSLVIPLKDSMGALQSLQFIKPDGSKLLLSGGKKKGHFHLIGDPGDVLLICEGYSTAATLYEATGYAAAMAVDAGNLMSVGKALRKKYPSIKIIFCADNDQYGEVNTGLNKATEAARVVKGFVAVPEFRDVTTKPTDFNDLARLEKSSTIRRVE